MGSAEALSPLPPGWERGLPTAGVRPRLAPQARPPTMTQPGTLRRALRCRSYSRRLTTARFTPGGPFWGSPLQSCGARPPPQAWPPRALRLAAGWALTRAAVGTLAVEGGHTVVAGGALEAGGAGAVVDVLAAVLTRPAVDAHAVVVTVGVVAGPAILAGVGHELALVHVLRAVLTCGGPGRSGRAVPPAPSAKPRPSPPPEVFLTSSTPASQSQPLPCAPGARGLLPGYFAGTGVPGSMLTCGQSPHPTGQHPCVLASKLGSHWGPDCGRPARGQAPNGPHRPTGATRVCAAPGGWGGASDPGGGQVSHRSSILPVSDLSSLLPAPHGGRLQQQRCPPGLPGVCTCPLRGAAAVVGVHAVHTGASVLAIVPRAVVNVFLAVLASEACSRGQQPSQASLQGWALTRPVTLALGAGTFLAQPRTPCSGRRAALHGLPCDAHRLGALGVPAPHPALLTPATGFHTPEPTVSTFLSNHFVKGQLNRWRPTIIGSPGFCRRRRMCRGLCAWATPAGPALCSAFSAHPHVWPWVPHLTRAALGQFPRRELEQGDSRTLAGSRGCGGVCGCGTPPLPSSRGAGRVGAPQPLPAGPTSAVPPPHPVSY